MSVATRAAESKLRRALWASFALIRQEAEGTLPAISLVRGRAAELERAWAACPTAPRVFAETKAAWWAETGRCPVGGERAPCTCDGPGPREVTVTAAAEVPARG